MLTHKFLLCTIIPLALMALSIQPLAWTQPPASGDSVGAPPTSPPRFNAIERFKEADTNADGFITLDEFLAIKRPEPGQRGQDRPVPPRQGLRQGQGRGQEARRGEGGRQQRESKPPIPPEERRRLRAEEIFRLADVDKDGKLSLEEFKAHIGRPKPKPQGPIPPDKPTVGPAADRGPIGKELLQKADMDKDGKVTFDELKAIRPHMTEERFDWLDANDDGVLTEEDLAIVRQQMTQRFKSADVDNDGKLSLDEAKKAFPFINDEAFQRRDINKDGYLTFDEFKPRPQGKK